MASNVKPIPDGYHSVTPYLSIQVERHIVWITRPRSGLLWVVSFAALTSAVGCGTSKPGLSPHITMDGAVEAAGPGGGGDAAGEAVAPTDTGAPVAAVDAGFGGPPPPLTEEVTIHVAGDSTAAIFPPTDPTGRVGWAAVLQSFFGDGVTVNDAARSGRSSKSFIDEGHWNLLKAQIHVGDYVFIQFAHNDEKVEDPTRYSDPATTFRDYLRTFIRDTRLAGGFAVLMTPIHRRQFSGGKIVATHGLYPAAISAVATETGTPLIDMAEKTRVLLEGLGPDATVPLFATADNTHLSALGAPEVAKLAVEGIRELNFPLVERLRP